MQIKIDRDLPVAVAVQVQGQIEYGVTVGDVPLGAQLPSVRELAAHLGVSPVTVSAVYRSLQDKGLIKTVRGRGTFVRTDITVSSERKPRSCLDELMTQVIHVADRDGLTRSELIQRFHGFTAQVPSAAAPLQIVFVGVFANVTRAYVADLERHLRPSDTILATTFDEVIKGRPGSDAVQQADLVLTFAHRIAEVKRVVPASTPVATVKLIPSERTRVALAEIDPLSTLVIVSTVPEFLLSFRRAVARYAGHVDSVRAIVWDGDQVSASLGDADIVVYGTGSEAVLEGLPGHVRAFEYRHVPDPRQVERVLLPLIDRLRIQSDGRTPNFKETS
jgi:DNA-binding transcriptional regulator YhcF (GntR family)